MSDSVENSESGNSPGDDPLAHCAAQVRQYDRDRYLASLFAPDDRRAALVALYAFNLEIARIGETVSEVLLGRMRLQWWRDSVGALFGEGTPPSHPVLIALAATLSRHDLSRHLFEALLDAREFDLEEGGPANMDQLVSYAEGSAGALSQLAIQALGATGEDARNAARHGGIAWGLVGLLRAAPFHAARGISFLPRDLMETIGGSGEGPAVKAIATEARMHITAARALHASVPAGARAALLPLALIDGDLARLERSGLTSGQPAHLGRLIRLAMAALRGRY